MRRDCLARRSEVALRAAGISEGGARSRHGLPVVATMLQIEPNQPELPADPRHAIGFRYCMKAIACRPAGADHESPNATCVGQLRGTNEQVPWAAAAAWVGGETSLLDVAMS